MLKATWKSLWARKFRLTMSALSIVLGVAFVCGSLMFTALLRSSFDQIVAGGLADINVQVDGASLTGTGGSTPTSVQELTPAQVDEIGQVAGVEKAVGVVSSAQVFPMDKEGSLLSFPGAPGIAMNWHDTPAAGGQVGARIIDGKAPAADSDLVMDPATVERGGYAIGDQVQVSTPLDGVKSYTLVGTGTFGAGSTAGASYLFFTTAEAQTIIQQGADTFSAVWVQTDPGAEPATVAKAIAASLPEGFEAKTGEELAKTVQDQLDVGLGFVNVFLLVFAGIALLVATLLILNTFSILVAQRSRELALLRAIGATRSQVRNSVLLEAAVIGVVGATIGLVAGYGLTWAILAAMRLIGMDLGDVVPTFTWQAIAASYGIGVVITMIAAYLPSRRASRTRPVEAMTSAAQSGPEKLGGLTMVGVALIEIGIAGIVCAVWLPVPQPLVWLGTGAALLLVGMVLAAAFIGGPVVWLFGQLFRRAFGEVGRLATLNAVRQPRRTAATAATLMIGLSLVSAVAILASSTTTSLTQRLSADQRGDFLITSPTGTQPFDAKVAQSAREVAGISDVFEFYRSSATVGGNTDPVSILGASKEAIERGTSLKLIAGSLEADGDALPAVVDTSFASDHGLSLGQILDLTGPKRSIQVLVTGISDGSTAFSMGQIIINQEAFAQVADTSLVSELVIFTQSDAQSDTVKEGLRAVVDDLPTVSVSDVHEYVEARVGQFSQLFSVIYALLALAIVISVLGIVNTLGLSVVERTREIGLVRAVGMTRRQVRSMITLESVIVSTLGAVLGVVLGLIFGAALVTLLRDQGINLLIVPWAQLGVFVLLAAVCGVLAAIMPARRAARHNVLESIVVE